MHPIQSETSELQWRCPTCASAVPSPPGDLLYCPACQANHPQVDRVWECARKFVPPGFSNARREHLEEIQQDHFWFPPRERLLKKKLRRLCQESSFENALELGCGSGRFLPVLRQFARTCVGVDGHVSSLHCARQNDDRSLLIHSDVGRVPLQDGQFDLVVALDVLEHVDPHALLGEAWRLARPRGRLLISVPAFRFLWSAVDKAAGHRCRYQIGALKRELEATRWRLCGYTHYQFLLFPALLASRFVNRRKQPQLERHPPSWLGRICETVNELEVSMFGNVRLPLGSSLIAWATKS